MMGSGRINAFQTLSGTSGISEGNEELTTLIYPNPSNGSFTILSENAETVKTVKLTHVEGKVLKEIVPSFIQNEMSISLNVAPGVYALSLISDGKIERLLVRVL